MEKDSTIGIIGCGNMGGAIAKGIVSSGLIPAKKLYLYDIDKDKRNCLLNALNASGMDSPEELADFCGIILLAVKPQDFGCIGKKLWELLDGFKLLISIAAGITFEHINKYLKQGVRMARVMPNMPALVKEGISALCYNSFATFRIPSLLIIFMLMIL